MIRLLEDYLQNRTDSIIDKVCEQGHAEFVEDLSSELLLQAIAEMVGIPIEDRSKIFDWTNCMIGGNDPDLRLTPTKPPALRPNSSPTAVACRWSVANQPADDIITTLLSADVDGEKLSEDEFDMFFLLLSVAGNETTRNSITCDDGILRLPRSVGEVQE